jgi:hypothetical protein
MKILIIVIDQIKIFISSLVLFGLKLQNMFLFLHRVN